MKRFYRIKIIVLQILSSHIGHAHLKNQKCEFRRHKYITQDATREQYETGSLAILAGSCQWFCFVFQV